MGASVKIMLSYDYCHFEVCLSTSKEIVFPDQIPGEEGITLKGVDEMRKDCQRLADKAVRQYKTAKYAAQMLLQAQGGVERARRNVQVLKENFPQSEWTPDQKAQVKALEDYEFVLSHPYDYEDDWEGDDYED